MRLRLLPKGVKSFTALSIVVVTLPQARVKLKT